MLGYVATMPDYAARSTESQGCKIDIGSVGLHTSIVGDGEPVLLVAGLGGRGEFWKHQVAALAKRFRVVAFDHRGCGRSTPGVLTASVAQLADDVVALLDALDLEKVSLIGHSTGGAIGQHIALGRPERLSRLILSSTWPGPDAYFLELFRLRRSILENCGPSDYLSSGTFLATSGSDLQRAMAAGSNSVPERLAAFPGLAVELSRLDAVVRHDLSSRLGEIAIETLCIAAKDDLITPYGFTEELARLIPHARISLFELGGHFLPQTNPKAYNAMVLDFLRGCTEDET